MNSMITTRTKALLAAAGVAGALAAGVGFAGSSSGDSDRPLTQDTNQSSGSAAGARSDADLPDLVQAYATNGKIGYITKADFVGPALTIDQVQELPTTGAGLESPRRTVPVYERDRRTVIGEFQFGN